ncbi:CWF19-like protein 2 isoform X2 [Apostichopus japonicus]
MLPAVSDALDDQKSKKKRRKKEKDRKKHKKSKKRRTKEKEKDSTSDSSDSAGEEQWVEAGTTTGPTAASDSGARQTPQKGHEETPPALQEPQKRDSWMESPFLTATYSSSEIRKQREEKKKEEIEKERKLHSLDNGGRSDRELNPFWKDGGTGLPEEDPTLDKRKPHVGVGDKGVGWLRKSYERVKQQAAEEGRPFEEVAAERWGSLEKIHAMLEEAEGGRHRPSRMFKRGGQEDGRGWRRDDYGRDGYTRKSSGEERGESRDRSRREGDSGRSDGSKREAHRDGTRGRFLKPGDGDKNENDEERGRRKDEEEGTRRSSGSLGSSRGQFRKPKDDESAPSARRMESKKFPSGLGSLRGQFKKPGEDDGRRTSAGGSKSRASGESWRKAGYEKQKTDSPSRSEETEKRKESDQNVAVKNRISENSTSSSSSSSSGEEEEEAPPRILSKDEMNQLGAKIVRAEIMGNQKLVDDLKKQLEAARQVAAAGPKAGERRSAISKDTQQGKERQSKEEETVILSRTNRMGQSYPLPEEAGYVEKGGKKRRKNKGVETHGKDGERERYFGNDDNVDLKTMVQQEKMGLAEDQNRMFAKAQARALKSLNEEYTLDDMFVSTANTQSDRDEMQRQRENAIKEHRKMEAALSRCPFCIDSPEMQKHLIIALGIKVYLCLPRTKSLTAGHCLIVPMQHSSACTAVDEDVWNEIQIFRKGLTKMFEDQGKDAVFIEYSSSGKTQRHMCLECIPVPNELGEMGPIFFKKAIQESETEWSQNKKLIDTRKKDIRHSVPKGFPYFSVDFGLDGGFAHVIEDNQLFPHYFGKEVLGGMMDLEPRLWRNPPKENFDSQRQKVIEFGSWWKPFDWTQKIDREKT